MLTITIQTHRDMGRAGSGPRSATEVQIKRKLVATMSSALEILSNNIPQNGANMLKAPNAKNVKPTPMELNLC